MRSQLIKYLFSFLFFNILILISSCLPVKKSIIVISIVESSVDKTKTNLKIGKPVIISKDLSVLVQGDGKDINILMKLKSQEIINAFQNIDFTLWFNSPKNEKYGLRFLQCHFVNEMKGASIGVENLVTFFPDIIRDKYYKKIAEDDILAYFIFHDRKLLFPVTDFKVNYLESDSTFHIKIPLISSFYPNGRFPVSKKGKSDIEIEIGENVQYGYPNPRSQSLEKGEYFKQTNGRYYKNMRRRYYKRIKLELIVPSDLTGVNMLNDDDFSFFRYFQLINKWIIRSKNESDNRGYARGTGSVKPIFPIEFQALILSDLVVHETFNYFSTLLTINSQEQIKLEEDFFNHWQYQNSTPIIVNISTDIHESYLDVNRWIFFVEDFEGEKFELKPTKTDHLNRNIFSETACAYSESPMKMMKQKKATILFLLQRYNYNQNPILNHMKKKLKFSIIGQKNNLEKMEIEWSIPKKI